VENSREKLLRGTEMLYFTRKKYGPDDKKKTKRKKGELFPVPRFEEGGNTNVLARLAKTKGKAMVP